ncbi:aspartate aminotransferase family protein [Alloacidobacterium sp.]|uniref:aspartate aminotransferase family protein n=1 Tax=Alloacidobacterium sp. TaxID=2951999 RepID=UPI002D6A7B82|nr:aspartate aminotransferase family protein [Alloacidobacterium sp.]HYK38097.1 aspartate aminotransferase family protein [Alloacidobacterium sp.]
MEARKHTAYESYVNPQWVRLLNQAQMNAEYDVCQGDQLHTRDGRVIHDFLSGYCVYNAGHNHPRIIEALREELESSGPSMLQSHVAASAGELAEMLCSRAGGRLRKVFFTSSGSEGIETAIKFTRATTGRDGLLAARNAFHGLTCGALSLTDNRFWLDSFGPPIPGVTFVDFGDGDALERELSTSKYAAFFLEPIQGEGGIVLPPDGYLRRAQELCGKHGTLFVLDEVQTGLYRTGRFLAAHHYALNPDMVILAKALSGGLVPVGAVLMTDEIYNSIYSSPLHAMIHSSTYGENSLAMRAGLSTIKVLEQEDLGPRALRRGEQFRMRLDEVLSRFEMVSEVRGLGFFIGIVFSQHRTYPGIFGQMVVTSMFREHGILTQVCGNNAAVLRATPPLNISEEGLDRFAEAMEQVMETAHSSNRFWQDAMQLVGRTARDLRKRA